MTPELALKCLWKSKPDDAIFTDKLGKFFFDKDFHYEVYCERKRLGLSVKETNIDLTDTHPLVGKRLLLKDGRIVKVKSAHRHWYMGSYITLITELPSESSIVITWEDIDLFDKTMRKICQNSHDQVERVLEC